MIDIVSFSKSLNNLDPKIKMCLTLCSAIINVMIKIVFPLGAETFTLQCHTFRDGCPFIGEIGR